MQSDYEINFSHFLFLISLVFSRNIKDFMVQTGDPTGTGKGGTSIWGKKFDDEFHNTLKVSQVHLFLKWYN